MLENLDIVLAFTMIMLLLSLLATIVVQMVVSLLGLRGQNLFWAVKQLFMQVAPATVDDVEKTAARVAGKVLGHAVLAPHAWIRKRLQKLHEDEDGEAKPWQGKYGPTALRLKELMLIVRQLRARNDGGVTALLPGSPEEDVGAIGA